jgi:hypothetical protein
MASQLKSQSPSAMYSYQCTQKNCVRAIFPLKLAFMVAGPGMLILLFLFVARAIRSNALAGGLIRRP